VRNRCEDLLPELLRLTRSFDQRSHSCLGYLLRLRGDVTGESGEFAVAIGKGAHEKFAFQAGDRVRGLAQPVADPRIEIADYYRVSGTRSLPKLGCARRENKRLATSVCAGLRKRFDDVSYVQLRGCGLLERAPGRRS